MKTEQNKISTSVTSVDAKNLSNAKINLSKSNFDFEKEGISGSTISKKSLYKGMDGLSTDEKKNHRREIRKNLSNFIKDILGKDRSNEQREKAVSEFLSFYKKNWITTDFKIETFSEKKNEADLRDMKKLLSFVKSVIE